MKRRVMGLLLACLLAGIGSGCGARTGDAVSAGSSSAAASSSSEAEETPEPTQSRPTEAVTASSVADESAVASSSEEQLKRIEIEIPQKDGMQAVYDTVEGLVVKPGTHIAVVAKGMNTGYWKAVRQGARQAVAELNEHLGYTGDDEITMVFEGPAEEGDIDAQINTIDTVISENPDVLCLGVIDMQSCQAQLESAQENGIPVIITDSGVESDLVRAMCAIDNRAAGREAALRLCEAIGDKGEIMVVAHQRNTETSLERVEGFQTEIETNHPDVEIVQINYGDGDATVGELVDATLLLHPDIAGVFCTNESMSIQTLEALDGKDGISLIGFDSGEKQVAAVRDGRETGMISQNPYGLGYATIVAAARAAEGLPVDSFIDVGYVYLDQTTVDQEEYQKYIYE